MALGFELPIFAPGVASAQELNKLSVAQEYVQNVGAYNYASLEIIEDSVRYILHRYRYLHWYCFSGNSELFVNGVKVAECNPTTLWGSVDLNTLGIAYNAVYSVMWDNGPDGQVQGIYLLEHPATSFGVSYPYPIPNFAAGEVLTSTKLNYLSLNTKYLLDYYASSQGSGFPRVVQETLNEFGGAYDMRQEWNYWIRHEHRYLYVATDRRCFGDPGATRRIKLLINGTAYYQDTDTYPQWWPHSVALDLSGAGDHHVYQGSNNPITAPSIGKGNWYRLTIFMQTQFDEPEVWEDLPQTNDECYIHIAGEMPARDWI